LVVAGLVLGLGSVSGVVCWLTALGFVGMGGACVLAGLLSELMIRQRDPQHATDCVVVDTHRPVSRERLSDQVSKDELIVAPRGRHELLAI
jgi:hypothetical protein